MVLWLDEGPLVEIYKKKWGHRLVDKAASNSKIPNYYFSLCYSKISESTHMEFVQAFKDLEMEYRKRCAREIKLDATNLLDATMVICMTPEGFFD
ncbi:MAG: hypothetical protein NTV34_10060 [Proteobacteria bacterium]|nr:hypothetical protein [Pseudomonadota bacterium]